MEERKNKYPVLFQPNNHSQKEDFKKQWQDYINEYGYSCQGVRFPVQLQLEGEIKDADFRNAYFRKGIKCEKATLVDVDFSNAIFDARSEFDRTIFTGEKTNFSNAFLRGFLSFCNARFRANLTDFSGKDTEGILDFSSAKFLEGETSFKGRDFSQERQNFSNAKFEGNSVSFVNCDFKKGVLFDNTTFDCNASFQNATFRGSLSRFKLTIFSGDDTNFRDATFGDEKFSFFANSRFEGEGEVSFAGAYFGNILELKGWKDKTVEHLVFNNSSRVDLSNLTWLNDKAYCRLVDANLANVSFLNTDLRRAEFISVNWSNARGNFTLYDERSTLKAERQFEKLEILYRDLKYNYENARDYATAGAFHYREKEMRRLKSRTTKANKTIPFLYKIFSGYGERVKTPLFWLAGIFIVGAVYFKFNGLSFSSEIETTHAYAESLVYSFQNLFFLRPRNPAPYGQSGELVRIAQSLLGPFFLGLFGLALRQRVKR